MHKELQKKPVEETKEIKEFLVVAGDQEHSGFFDVCEYSENLVRFSLGDKIQVFIRAYDWFKTFPCTPLPKKWKGKKNVKA
jgi:hypothetical protein